ncbi:hypothetical protein AAES_49766 [Amazona aestiva]|uniref:Uncharacterized protein n=1 Tax=Amazona aestiva TaxID=12930 RepID=A0A0Q3MQD8_AMAAE|nr:hypothetical protein AAES_49766 [Amazona aestiva]
MFAKNNASQLILIFNQQRIAFPAVTSNRQREMIKSETYERQTLQNFSTVQLEINELYTFPMKQKGCGMKMTRITFRQKPPVSGCALYIYLNREVEPQEEGGLLDPAHTGKRINLESSQYDMCIKLVNYRKNTCYTLLKSVVYEGKMLTEQKLTQRAVYVFTLLKHQDFR